LSLISYIGFGIVRQQVGGRPVPAPPPRGISIPARPHLYYRYRPDMSCHNVDAAAATIDAFTDRVPDNTARLPR